MAAAVPAPWVSGVAAQTTNPLMDLLRGLLSFVGFTTPTAPTGPMRAAVWGLVRGMKNIVGWVPVAGTPTVGTPDPTTGVVTGTLNFTEPAGLPMTYAVATNPTLGSVTVNSAGVFTYTPTTTARQAATAATADSFVVTASDAKAATSEQVVVPVLGMPTPPPPQQVVADKAYFAPYVQMSGWPVPILTQMSKTAGTSLLITSFIQADSNGNPGWGGQVALEPNSTNAQAQAINKSIADFKAGGGDVMISFGGADGTTLSQYYATHNLSAQALANAFGSVVTTYGVTHLDFDIEGTALSDTAAVALQTQAIALLQKAHPEVKVWFTLPVLPTGFPADSKDAVTSALIAGVKLAGVNIMAMDYGESNAPTTGPNAQTMGTYAILAAQSSYAQLSTLQQLRADLQLEPVGCHTDHRGQ